MENFQFYNPTKVIFGKETHHQIGEVLRKDGIKKVLFVYGQRSIKETGLYDDIIKSLEYNKIRYIEHSGVKPNPVLSHTIEGIKKAKEFKVDAVLSVGGGSVLDEGKAIAVGAVDDGDLWDFFTHKRQIVRAIPNYTVLTLAATGSEMNGYAVITNEETMQKLSISSIHIFPKVSILNPQLTLSVPLSYQSFASVDTLAHVIEWYLTCTICPNISNLIVESIVKSVINSTQRIFENPTDYNARAEFMWTATLALNGITRPGYKDGLYVNHMIAHSLGAIYNLPHGASLSIVIPAWMWWYKDKNTTQFERFAKNIFNLHSKEEGIKALKNWFSSIKAPVSLQDAGIPSSDVDKIADHVYTTTAKIWKVDKIYTKEKIREILYLALRSNL